MDENRPVVSVIVPCYNCASYIEETVRSVQKQTVRDIEILLIDDCSSDATLQIIERLSINDQRIRIFRQDNNKGVALARNMGLNQAAGQYIAYLDSDDVWLPMKLEHQLRFMQSKKIGSCFTSYETIEEDGTHRNNIHVPAEMGYKDFLKNMVTCSHTLVFDTALVDKNLLKMPNLRRGQDAATWLQVLKAGHRFYGLDEILAKYRKHPGSLSSNKITALRRSWNLYWRVEKLPFFYAVFCQFCQLTHAIRKRIKD